MSVSIRIKRGLEANLPSLQIGELAYTTDTNKLFIGVNTGTEQDPVIESVLVNDLSALENYFTKTEIEDLVGTGLSWNEVNEVFSISVDTDTIFANPTFTGTVKVPLPIDPDAATNKSYVDALAQGIKARSQALVLVGTPLAGTYDSEPALHEFEAAANGPFPAVDGISSETLNVVGARIVLAAQTNAAHNGLYVLKTIGDSETKWVLRRCTQCDTSEKVPGSFVFITKGTNFENTGWIFDVANPLTFAIGTDAINVIQFSGAGAFTPGTGLDLDGNEFLLADEYGDIKNPYGEKTSKHFLAAPNASNGVPSFRAIVPSDIPILNQNTTGTAANVTETVAIANGGTGATTVTGAKTELSLENVTNESKATMFDNPTFTGQVVFTPATLTTTGSSPSFSAEVNFANSTYLTQSTTGETVSYSGTNYANGRSVTIRVLNGASQTTLAFPVGWRFLGDKPANIAPNKLGVLTLASFGTSESDVVAAWAVET